MKRQKTHVRVGKWKKRAIFRKVGIVAWRRKASELRNARVYLTELELLWNFHESAIAKATIL